MWNQVNRNEYGSVRFPFQRDTVVTCSFASERGRRQMFVDLILFTLRTQVLDENIKAGLPIFIFAMLLALQSKSLAGGRTTRNEPQTHAIRRRHRIQDIDTHIWQLI